MKTLHIILTLALALVAGVSVAIGDATSADMAHLLPLEPATGAVSDTAL